MATLVEGGILEAGETGQRDVPPSRRKRIAFAAAIALAAVGILAVKVSLTSFPPDFDQLWFGARALWTGQNPYDVIGPGRAFEWPWPLYYPATALVAVSPLALLPIELARYVFVGGSAGLMAYAMTRDSWARVPLCASVSFWIAAGTAQWSPLLVAAVCVPPLAIVLAAKPNIGVSIVAYDGSGRVLRWAAAGGVAIALLSVALRPSWPLEWLALVRAAPGFDAPVTYLGGPLLLLAALRWRTGEGRLLLALALIPHNVTPYSVLLLFLTTRSFRESLLLAALINVAVGVFAVFLSPPTNAAAVRYQGDLFVALCYLPCVIMLLRRPNKGEVPAWAESLVAHIRYRFPRGQG